MSTRLEMLNVGDLLPERSHTASNVSLFLYNAIIWNPHRIHYDRDYTINVEKHPEIVIDGPLQGDWLAQAVTDWIGEDGRLQSFEYSNRKASYLGETLTSGGRVSAIDAVAGTADLEIFIRNEQGQIVTPGSATVQFDGA